MTDLAIETHHLVKVFGTNRAVDGVDLAIARGGLHGFLGPNGAGKTTTIRMLATLSKPDGGTARVLGRDVVTEADQVRRRVSLTGQFASVDEDLTGRENLRLLGRLFGYTGSGATRRADELLFLDEPTTGLDPRSRNEVWDIVRAMVASGTTVLLTTQYLDEADQLADRISVIDNGKVIAEGTSSELKASVGSGSLHVRVMDRADREAARHVLERELGVDVREMLDPTALGASVDGSARVTRALTALDGANIPLAQFSLGQPALDEVFLTLTGHPADTGQSDTGEDAA